MVSARSAANTDQWRAGTCSTENTQGALQEGRLLGSGAEHGRHAANREEEREEAKRKKEALSHKKQLMLLIQFHLFNQRKPEVFGLNLFFQLSLKPFALKDACRPRRGANRKASF